MNPSRPLLPSDFLAEWEHSASPLLFLLTGASGAGKTTWCLALAQEATARGRTVSGVCSPAVFENGHKIGIDLVDLHSSMRRHLAVRKTPGLADPQAASRDWLFDEQTLEWGNSLISTAGHDLLILDELGPLEFMHARGWINAFSVLDTGGFNLACVVVRPSLLMQAQDRWPSARLLDIGDQPS